MTADRRPCLNRPGCGDQPGFCFVVDNHTDQALLHAHHGLQPDQCRTCGQVHDGEPNGCCEDCHRRLLGQDLRDPVWLTEKKRKRAA